MTTRSDLFYLQWEVRTVEGFSGRNTVNAMRHSRHHRTTDHRLALRPGRITLKLPDMFIANNLDQFEQMHGPLAKPDEGLRADLEML